MRLISLVQKKTQMKRTKDRKYLLGCVYGDERKTLIAHRQKTMCEILRNNQRNFKEQTVSTCVEATRCKYAPDLEAIEVDISPTASVTDN